MAIPQHHNADEWLAIHRLLWCPADRSQRRRHRFGHDATIVDQPHNASDYFGRGDNNASFFNIPINLPNGTGPNHGRFGTLGRSTFRGPGFRTSTLL
jgi:hypothetical protein